MGCLKQCVTRWTRGCLPTPIELLKAADKRSNFLLFEDRLRTKYQALQERTLKTRFPVNRQDHTQKHPNGYLTPILKKLLNREMSIKDPEVQRIFNSKIGTKAQLKKILALRWILNGIQGDNEAIKEIFNRIDGKTDTNDKGGNQTNIIIQRIHYGKIANNEIPNTHTGISAS